MPPPIPQQPQNTFPGAAQAQPQQPAPVQEPQIESQREPNVKDQSLPEKKLDDKMGKFVNDLRGQVRQHDIDGTNIYRLKMMTARNQRQGIKQVSNVPYPGAPDIPLPQADKLIRKQKPNYVLSAVSGKNIMVVNPAEGVQKVNDALKEKARKANLAMNDLFRNKIPWARRLTLAADRSLEKGSAIFKIIERFQSRIVSHVIDLSAYDKAAVEQLKTLDKAGKTKFLVDRYGFDVENEFDKGEIEKAIKQFEDGKDTIEFNTEEVTSQPDVIIPLNEKIFVPKGTGSDIGGAARVTHEYFLPKNKLIDGMLKGIFLKAPIEKVVKKQMPGDASETDLNEEVKSAVEGVETTRVNGELYRIHETLTWYQPADDAPFERWVFTFLADVSSPEESLIQFMPYNYEDEDWCYVKHDNEIIDDRYYASRGIPEQIRALQEMEERAVNNMLIRDEINNAPMFTVIKNSAIMASSIRFVPGQKIPVADHGEIKQLTEIGKVDVSSQNISQILKAYAEEYIGSTDQLYRNATNAGGGKTLGEIQQGTAKSQYIQNLDILNWLDTLRKVYTKVFFVMRERLTTPLIINGEVITREDFNFIPDIRPSGSLEEADRELQSQKALTRLNIIRQAKADGCATLDNVYAAYEDFIERDGMNDATNLLTDPKIIMQEQITQMEQKAQQLNGLIAQQNQVLAEGEKGLDNIQNKMKQGADNEQGQPQPNGAGQTVPAAGTGATTNP